MSFILDALRKSEAARRRSEAPDLFAAMPATAEPLQSRPNWPLWSLGAVAACSLIAALWLLAQRVPEAPTESAPTASPTVDASAETASMDDAVVGAPARESMAEPVAIPTPPRAQPPLAPAQPPAAAAAPSPATSPPTVPLSPTPREMPAPLSDAAAAAAPIMPLALPSTGSVVSLADLDPATRKLLPPLKLSMHLWNETPAQRFVILDGQRLREGDLLGELVIERITRDGAVLAWRGGQLRIELR